jgi:hypothetical protein
MMHPTISDLYSTSDLGIATFLITKGHRLSKTTWETPRKLIFHYEKKDITEDLVTRYLNGTGQASAKKLFSNYRNLRAMAFNQRSDN